MQNLAFEDTLANELRRLEVPFLRVNGLPEFALIPTIDLLVGLAQSSEARVRLALIPLLLCHPEMAEVALAVAERLLPGPRLDFECYYTAAVLLQRRFVERLIALGLPELPLPDHFSERLRLLEIMTVDDALTALAERHAALSGMQVNWRGTYEHGALKLIKALERQKQWENKTQNQ